MVNVDKNVCMVYKPIEMSLTGNNCLLVRQRIAPFSLIFIKFFILILSFSFLFWLDIWSMHFGC